MHHAKHFSKSSCAHWATHGLRVFMNWKCRSALVRCAPVVRFKMKVFCPECNLRVLPRDVGEIKDMRDVCKTMWRKFMQLDDRHCPLFRTCEVKDVKVQNDRNENWSIGENCDRRDRRDAGPSLWRPMPRLKGRS
eukprot:s4145_g6.t1